MSTEVFISHSDYKNQKLFRRSNNVFYNAKIDGKKDFAASCNEEDLENKDHGNEASNVILSVKWKDFLVRFWACAFDLNIQLKKNKKKANKFEFSFSL